MISFAIQDVVQKLKINYPSDVFSTCSAEQDKQLSNLMTLYQRKNRCNRHLIQITRYVCTYIQGDYENQANF
jgi:primosomal protein N''